MQFGIVPAILMLPIKFKLHVIPSASKTYCLQDPAPGEPISPSLNVVEARCCSVTPYHVSMLCIASNLLMFHFDQTGSQAVVLHS